MTIDGELDELAARARGGDQRAFEALVRRVVRPALAAAWEFVPTREDAEDVVQETFVRVWRSLGCYDPARPFAPWFFTILRNVARNAARATRLATMIPLAEAERADEPMVAGDEPEPAFSAELAGQVHAALDELSPMQRACFRLATLEGFGSAEAGAMLGVSDATVRVHVHRARKALRTRFAAAREGELHDR
jgi:RNA polymerase sigma-70 factor (ECF subfamily)